MSKPDGLRDRSGRVYTEEQKAKKKAYMAAYVRKDPEKHKAYHRDYYQANKHKTIKQTVHAYQFRAYGITQAEVDTLFALHNDCCHCCGIPVSRHLSGAKKIEVGHIDHCHSSGKVRGILCSHCNAGLGLLRDRPDLAVAYLEKSA